MHNKKSPASLHDAAPFTKGAIKMQLRDAAPFFKKGEIYSEIIVGWVSAEGA
jgi:hypothetical protein